MPAVSCKQGRKSPVLKQHRGGMKRALYEWREATRSSLFSVNMEHLAYRIFISLNNKKYTLCHKQILSSFGRTHVNKEKRIRKYTWGWTAFREATWHIHMLKETEWSIILDYPSSLSKKDRDYHYEKKKKKKNKRGRDREETFRRKKKKSNPNQQLK